MIVSLAPLREQAVAQAGTPEFRDGDPRKLNPISLEQQKKRAKEFLRELDAASPAARSRLHASFSGQRRTAMLHPRLADAQRMLAKELGFPDWSALKAHTESNRIARQALAQGSPSALDAGIPTLHIRCGHDIMHKLAVAGFSGDYLCFADPYIFGPVPQTATLDEFLHIRAEVIAPWRGSFEAALERLRQEYAALEQAAAYPRVMLWFEHDSYDQLILAKLLHFFRHAQHRPAQLRFISVNDFPGVERFIGIGQLPAQAMRVLWERFEDVTEPQLELGARAWEALTAADPSTLQAMVTNGTSAVPVMAAALQRHLRELPSVDNGLSLTEELTLRVLADKGAMNAGRLFGWYTNRYEPLPFLGDLQYFQLLSALATADTPALQLMHCGEKPADWKVALTPFGAALLDKRTDWLANNRVRRWVGGILIDSSRTRSWRFDPDGGSVVRA